MGLYNTTQYALRHSVAYSLDDMAQGKAFTAQTGSSNSLAVCSYLTESNDYWNGWDFHVFAGSGVGQSQRVNDFHNANTTLAFSPVLTTALTANSQFEMHKKFTTTQYNDAIDRAIEMGKDEYLFDKNDETATLTEDTYEYSIPSGFRYISGIWKEDLTDADTYYPRGFINGNHWDILRGSTPKIKFSSSSYPISAADTDQKLRIVGQSVQASLTNDDDTCAIPPEFIIQQARALLLDTIDGKEAQAGIAQNKASIERRLMRVMPYPGSKSVYEI